MRFFIQSSSEKGSSPAATNGLGPSSSLSEKGSSPPATRGLGPSSSLSEKGSSPPATRGLGPSSSLSEKGSFARGWSSSEEKGSFTGAFAAAGGVVFGTAATGERAGMGDFFTTTGAISSSESENGSSP